LIFTRVSNEINKATSLSLHLDCSISFFSLTLVRVPSFPNFSDGCHHIEKLLLCQTRSIALTGLVYKTAPFSKESFGIPIILLVLSLLAGYFLDRRLFVKKKGNLGDSHLGNL
jgi:hypothetical protein